MKTQSVSRKTKLTLGLLTILVSLFLLEGIKATTHHLSGRTFPEDLPLLAGLHPNDFLPGGTWLFAVNFGFRRYSDQQGFPTILSLFGVVASLMTLLIHWVAYLQGPLWRNEASQSIVIWIVAFDRNGLGLFLLPFKKGNTFHRPNAHN